jgi:hypothetical protein
MTYKQIPAGMGRDLGSPDSISKSTFTQIPLNAQRPCLECSAYDHEVQLPGFGLCRRHAPSVAGDEYWPRVKRTDWCLECKRQNLPTFP